MKAMSRAAVLFAVLTAAAVAGAYAQEALKQEDPLANDVVQLNVIYRGSFCGGENPGFTEFYFRPIRELKDGWVEAEYAWNLTNVYRQNTFKPSSELQRLNVRRMCAVAVATLK